jgi:hypothetical protein
MQLQEQIVDFITGSRVVTFYQVAVIGVRDPDGPRQMVGCLRMEGATKKLSLGNSVK